MFESLRSHFEFSLSDSLIKISQCCNQIFLNQDWLHSVISLRPFLCRIFANNRVFGSLKLICPVKFNWIKCHFNFNNLFLFERIRFLLDQIDSNIKLTPYKFPKCTLNLSYLRNLLNFKRQFYTIKYPQSILKCGKQKCDFFF